MDKMATRAELHPPAGTTSQPWGLHTSSSPPKPDVQESTLQSGTLNLLEQEASGDHLLLGLPYEGADQSCLSQVSVTLQLLYTSFLMPSCF